MVDETCLTTKPLSCIVCCDAPDFAEAEDEIKLKSICMDLDDATNWLPAFEDLILTPEEYDDKEELHTFNIMPPPILRFTDEAEHYCLAPLKQARKNKRRALRIIEVAIAKQAREARANKKGTITSFDVDQKLIENAQKLTIHESGASDVSESREGNSQDQQNEDIEAASKRGDEEVGESKTRIDPAKEDITIQTCSKVDVAHTSGFLSQLRLLSYQHEDEDILIRLVDNRTEDRKGLTERSLAEKAAGPYRQVYSPMRRIYGPIVQGKEDPVIASKGRDVGLSKRSDSSLRNK